MTKSFQHQVKNTIVQLLFSFRHSVLYVFCKPAPDAVCSSFYAIIKCTPSVNSVGKVYRGSTVLPEASRSSLHPLRTRIPSTQFTVFLALWSFPQPENVFLRLFITSSIFFTLLPDSSLFLASYFGTGFEGIQKK